MPTIFFLFLFVYFVFSFTFCVLCQSLLSMIFLRHLFGSRCFLFIYFEFFSFPFSHFFLFWLYRHFPLHFYDIYFNNERWRKRKRCTVQLYWLSLTHSYWQHKNHLWYFTKIVCIVWSKMQTNECVWLCIRTNKKKYKKKIK